MALAFVFAVTVTLTLEAMVRVAIVGEAVDLLVLSVGKLHDARLLHYQSLYLVSLSLQGIVREHKLNLVASVNKEVLLDCLILVLIV